MNDIALVWDPATGLADLAMSGPDLQMDHGLTTAAIISLFCDRLAEPGDVIPDGTDDPRGWWGDAPLPTASDAQGQDLTGSRLWLLARAKQLPETLRQAESYAREALAWMIEDRVASAIDAAATFPALGQIELDITISEPTGAATPFSFTITTTPVPALVAPLLTADGSLLTTSDGLAILVNP